jgi:hypothetical protein
MEMLQDRRLLLAVGGGVAALLISLGLAIGIMAREHRSKAPPPASTGGLVVQMGRADDAKLDPAQPLRCFVAGQFVGMLTLADCARKNGVATRALDVGVDPNGDLGAGAAGTTLTPLPPPAEASSATPETSAPALAANEPPARGPVGECLRYAGSAWRRVGDSLSLSGCVQALYAGRCEPPGGASYGRWMTQTLRLVPHRIEISSDNRSFHTVVEQNDPACAIPEF